MEAIKKAKELIKKSTSLGNSHCAKRHSLWLCDEIISGLKIRNGSVEYWIEVKQELEKL